MNSVKQSTAQTICRGRVRTLRYQRSSRAHFLRAIGSLLIGVLVFGALTSCVSKFPSVAIASNEPTASGTPSAIIRYNSIHHPVIAANGMVVSQNAVASRIGRDILARGGNAIDAAIATGFALAVTLPRAGNIGGSGFMMVYLKERDETIALDFRSMAPANMTEAIYTKADGTIDWDGFKFGPLAPAVPGTVAGFHQAWQRFGSLPWRELVEPAIKLARDGIVVTDDLAFVLAAASSVLGQYPGSAAIFMKQGGVLYQPGDRLVQSDLAWSLSQIALDGADAFYRGAIAKRLADGLQKDGGVITLKDFANYQVEQRTPITGVYRGHTVVSTPPVSSGGVTLIQMLNVLQNFDLARYPHGSADSLHLLAETMKRSAANRRFSLGDPKFSDVPVAGFTSKSLAAELAKQISLTRATPVEQISPADARPYESRETTHYSVVDKDGNAVATTYTLGYSFGSGYVVPGTGILLDNQVRNFTYNKPGHANAIEPGKRMLSTMTPTLVFDQNGKLLLVTGTPGGGRIINILLQVLVNVIDYDLNIAEATHVPRIHQQWRTPMLGVEKGNGVDTIKLLEARGHTVEQQQAMGSVQSILLKDGLLHGAADPRRPGALAVGVD